MEIKESLCVGTWPTFKVVLEKGVAAFSYKEDAELFVAAKKAGVPHFAIGFIDENGKQSASFRDVEDGALFEKVKRAGMSGGGDVMAVAAAYLDDKTGECKAGFADAEDARLFQRAKNLDAVDCLPQTVGSDILLAVLEELADLRAYKQRTESGSSPWAKIVDDAMKKHGIKSPQELAARFREIKADAMRFFIDSAFPASMMTEPPAVADTPVEPDVVIGE